MLKYSETDIVFREFPDETTLAINLTNCPNGCRGCHSPHLQTDTGTVLDETELSKLIDKNLGMMTCVGLMGGDNDPDAVFKLSRYIKKKYPNLKVGWYSGRDGFVLRRYYDTLDYIKIGPYVETMGPLDSPTTNQRMYKRVSDGWLDITERFWK